MWLAGRDERTRQAYGRDLADFARFAGRDDVDAAAALLLSCPNAGEANAIGLAYRTHLSRRGLAPATINRRLAALRSLVKLARLLGRVSWALEVESVPGETYRDTRGPGLAGVRRLLAALEPDAAAGVPRALRDRAIVRLLYDLALRRGEVVSLDVAHVDLEAGTLAVHGKGRAARERISMPARTRETLAAYLTARGTGAGPLFLNYDRRAGATAAAGPDAGPFGEGRRLQARSLYRIVRELGDTIGLRARPHGLRHAAITDALDATNGNVRDVQRFSRHRDVRTLTRYDDNRTDLGGEVAGIVAGRL